MKTELYKIQGRYDGRSCYVHARICAIDEDRLIMTAQRLNVAGCDVFSPLVTRKSCDGGRTWTEPEPDEGLDAERGDDGIDRLWCDATHLLHKRSGKPILCGHSVAYKRNTTERARDIRTLCYSVYDISSGSYRKWKRLRVPDRFSRGISTGCSQFVEDENGDLLIPTVAHVGNSPYSCVYVMRCGFDGEALTYKSVSNELRYDVARGIGEGSLVKFGGRYYLTIRNDECGLVSVSDDGEHFTPPEIWRWDDRTVLPTYNTQSHLLICGERLYLVYTRRAGSNDHVFRHRAPLFMAEIDTESLTVIRNTEIIVVPERGARLGNFGVTQVGESHAIIVAAEWMQPAGCEKYGSDNSIFICHVRAD